MLMHEMALIVPRWITDEHAITLATWGLVLATLLLVATALGTICFAWWQLSIQRKQSQIDNLERQFDRFEAEAFRTMRRRLARVRLNESDQLNALDLNDIPTELQEILDFFEHLGHLVRHDHIEAYGTWHTFATWIGPTYADARQYIAIEQLDDKTVYEDFVWLFKMMCKVDAEKGGEGLIWDDEDLAGYYVYERGPEIIVPRKKRARKRRKLTQHPAKSTPHIDDGTN